MSNKLRRIGLNGNKLKWIIGTHGHWKNKNPVAIFLATRALPIQPIHRGNGPNWLNSPQNTKMYTLRRAESLFTLCYEIPWILNIKSRCVCKKILFPPEISNIGRLDFRQMHICTLYRVHLSHIGETFIGIW